MKACWKYADAPFLSWKKMNNVGAEEGHEAGLKRLKSNEELKIVPFLTYVRSKWKKLIQMSSSLSMLQNMNKIT